MTVHTATALKVTTELGRGTHLSIVELLNALLHHAHESHASDIHIDPTASELRVRLRIDGVLHDSFNFPKHIHSEIISRIKIISKLRTDEHQATQDGRFRHVLMDNNVIDVRVSIIPTYHEENVVMRLLSNKTDTSSLARLGFSQTDQQKITEALAHPNGMILSTGPTGSGKTTTLYTLVQILNRPEISIVTIEDPIEYAMENIRQIQINMHTGLTFSNGLRSVLRQDPDVIMVGEIRDRETASIAVNTALTGHLLLSTLHTTDAATTLPRLLDMGIEEYLIASTVRIIIGQRLVRKICTQCKEKIKLTPIETESLLGTALGPLIEDNMTVCRGKGCSACGQTGYVDRVCINEVLVVDDTIRDAILRKAPAHEIKHIAVKNGMTTIITDGFQKIQSGETSIEEILRVVRE